MLYFTEIFDLFLLGTVMLVMSLSLYELFIDAEVKVASRLNIHTFDDLKTNLVSVVTAVMALQWPLRRMPVADRVGEALVLDVRRAEALDRTLDARVPHVTHPTTP